MSDEPLTNREFDALRDLGWRPAGGEFHDGVSRPALRNHDGQRIAKTRAEWRALIAEAQRPKTEDEIAFGKDAWVYCRQHMRAHQTGWCSVSPRDKIGLGVETAKEAEEKCREWGFELYRDMYPNGGSS